MKHRIRTAAIVMSAGLAASSARAFDLTWANAGGGSASVAGNWSPAQVPAAGDNLVFNVAATYPVTFNASVPTSHLQTFKKGTVSLTVSSPHTVSTNLFVGEVSGDNATMNLTSGTLTANGVSTVGVSLGAVGVLNVNSAAADLIFGNNLFVGTAGSGTLNVTNLGHVQVNGAFLPGTNPTGVATILVSGFQVAPIGNSFLEVLGLGESRIGQLGDASLTVSNGALASFADRLIIAHGSSSTSSVTVQTAGLLDARLVVGSDVFVGCNATAAFAAGNGTLNVNPGGTVTVPGTLYVGVDPDGGTGVLNVDGGTVTTDNLIIHDTQGTFSFTDGQVTVDSGTFDPAGIAYTLNGAGTPHLRLINGAGTTFSGIGFGLRVGTTASGILTISNNATLAVTSGSTILADSAGSGGTVNIVNASAQFGAMTIGNAGSALLNINGSSTVSSGTATLGAGASANATALNSGSLWTITGNAFVGGTSAAATGSGLLRTEAGGVTHITGNATIWDGGGSLEVDNSTLTVDGTITHRGTGIMTNGTMNTGSITVANGTISASGSINGSVLVTSTSASITANGNLVMGDPLTVNGFSNVGTLNFGGNTVTLLDSNVAFVNNCSLTSGGHLIAANGIQVSSGTTLSGNNSLVDANVTNGGSITAAGAGMRFGGIVTRSGTGTISGTTVGFNSGGGYSGDGTISAIVDFDAGSTCTASGILTMGNASSAIGVTMDGTLHCGSGTVTLLDLNGVALGTLTDLNGGNLVCSPTLIVNPGKTIEGTGFVQTPLLTVNGAIKPADLPSQPPHRGTLNVSGAVTLGANNTYFCDIDPGIEFATADRIQSSGAATINGALTVAFIDGYVPQANQTFDIVVGSSRTGVFTSTNFPPVGAFGPPHVEYTSDRARIIMCYVNCDGSVVAPTLTANDFQCFLNRFASQDPYANCDGSTAVPVLTANDFQCFLNKFASGCN